jgi:hypothetical protein
LPESNPAPVVQFFTRTGITAADGQHNHVYVASLILNAALVRRARRANSNAVTLKLISRPPACLPGVRLVEFKSGTLAFRTGNWAGPALTGCV